MEKKKLEPQTAKPAGPYSPGIKVGNFIFVSGQLPTEQNIIKGDIKTQTKEVFENIERVLLEAGLKLENVVKVTIFLSDLDYAENVNRMYSLYFSPPYPARSMIEVSRLPKNALLEVECIAVDTRQCDYKRAVVEDDCGGAGCQD